MTNFSILEHTVGRGPEIEVTVDSVPFFDLETFPGVKELDKVQDSNSNPIFVPGGMIMGSRKVSTIYVRQCNVHKYNEHYIITECDSLF